MWNWKLEDIVSQGIKGLVPYRPGKPIEDLERELGIRDTIKIASNENPVGPSPKAVEAAQKALPNLHRYPDGNATALKDRLSKHLGVKPANLIIGNGSNEILELALRTFLGRDGTVVVSEHAFVVYQLVTRAAGGTAKSVPMKGFTHDLEAMAKAIDSNTRLVVVANPNNPTGTFNTAAEVEALIGAMPKGCILVLDEAYAEYVTDPSYPNSIKYIDQPVIVARTFSKLYGLAGLRIGYGVACEDIVQYMNRVRQPFNANTLAQIAATVAIDDVEHQKLARKVNSDGMSFITETLKAMDLTWVPSVANFVLIDVERNGEEVFQKLLPKGVIVRPMGEYNYPEFIRVTIGTKEQNVKFLKALAEVLGRNAPV